MGGLRGAGGPGADHRPVALRANIDLFYTPGEILYGKRETQQLPAVGQRLRVGGMVMPGSVRRDPDSLKVNFSLYDAEGSVTVSYEGILPDLFREGRGGGAGHPGEGQPRPGARGAGQA
ncbi:Cytochrome c-type biogenesis protein CcmE [Salmonella enterica subsp. enterica serovar Napoli]|nr:Cytochrome c-type biogenesis protein CcmE [Salmonella enterica subsp. enterica serovar Napoli]